MEQWDYLFFAIATVLLLFGALYFLPMLRPPRVLPIEVCVFCLVLVAVGWFTVDEAGRSERSRVREDMVSFMPAFAEELAPLLARFYAQPSDVTLAAIRLAQQSARHANPEIIGTTVYRAATDGSLTVLAESFSDRMARTAKTELDLAHPRRGVDFQESLGDGKNLQGWAPIIDAQKKSQGVLYLEYSSVHLQERVKLARLARILGLAMIMLIGAGAIFVIRLLRDDLVALRRAEAKLRYSEERLWLHFHQAPLAIVENLPDGTISGWNPAAERIFGYTASEVVGKPSEMIAAPGDRARVRELLAEVVATRTARRNQNDNIVKGGRRISCEWHNTPLINTEGEVIGITSIVQDITERLKLEEDLRLAQRIQSVGQLAAGIAHDYNNLLTIIQGRSDLIVNRGDLSPRSAADLQQISQAAERAAKLTAQLLTFSRRKVMVRTPQNANEILSSAAGLLRVDLPDNLQLKCEFTPGLPTLLADRAMLTEAIMNLARNAIESMPGGGDLRFQTALVKTISPEVPTLVKDETGWAIKLQVSDTGSGMDTHQVARIFDPFFTTKDVGQGPGLGLAVVHGIVQEHGGAVEVVSEPGKGTVVSLFLPSSAPLGAEEFALA